MFSKRKAGRARRDDRIAGSVAGGGEETRKCFSHAELRMRKSQPETISKDGMVVAKPLGEIAEQARESTCGFGFLGFSVRPQ
jgi:hypothetical protein